MNLAVYWVRHGGTDVKIVERNSKTIPFRNKRYKHTLSNQRSRTNGMKVRLTKNHNEQRSIEAMKQKEENGEDQSYKFLWSPSDLGR